MAGILRACRHRRNNTAIFTVVDAVIAAGVACASIRLVTLAQAKGRKSLKNPPNWV
jgi:hypothetical protein